jgi:hypothetical protein
VAAPLPIGRRINGGDSDWRRRMVADGGATQQSKRDKTEGEPEHQELTRSTREVSGKPGKVIQRSHGHVGARPSVKKMGLAAAIEGIRGRFLRLRRCWRRGGAARMLAGDRGGPERRRKATAGARVRRRTRGREAEGGRREGSTAAGSTASTRRTGTPKFLAGVPRRSRR